jgi:predicted nuclease of predicted toxin-antitoxin system
MRFLVDVQLSRKLIGWFEGKAQQAEHVVDALGSRAADHRIVAHARSVGAVIVSKDADFLTLLEPPGSPKLLWVRVGNTSTHLLLLRLEAEWERIVGELQSGSVVELAPEAKA